MSEEATQHSDESAHESGNRIYNQIIENIEELEAGVSQEELEWVTAFMLANIVSKHKGDPENVTEAFRRVMIYACDIGNMSAEAVPVAGSSANTAQ